MSHSTVRTFLAFPLPVAQRVRVADWQRRAGQVNRIVELAMLHLTLCVVGESDQRDLFLARRVIAALGSDLPPAAIIRLGQIVSRGLGAQWVTRGSISEITEFFGEIGTRLSSADVLMLHRVAGLHPHVTLGYDEHRFAAFRAVFNWIPNELLLIESRWDGALNKRVHDVLHRWSLLPPAQSAFGFLCEQPSLREHVPA